jgi:hypothetical protein
VETARGVADEFVQGLATTTLTQTTPKKGKPYTRPEDLAKTEVWMGWLGAFLRMRVISIYINWNPRNNSLQPMVQRISKPSSSRTSHRIFALGAMSGCTVRA